MNDDLKERLLSWHPGQDEEALREEAVARITDLETRLAAAEAECWELHAQIVDLKACIAEMEAGEDALAKAGRKAVAQLVEHGSDGYASGLDAALAAYEERRK